MDKIKIVKVKNPDGLVGEKTYTISVDTKNIDVVNKINVQDAIDNYRFDKRR